MEKKKESKKSLIIDHESSSTLHPKDEKIEENQDFIENEDSIEKDRPFEDITQFQEKQEIKNNLEKKPKKEKRFFCFLKYLLSAILGGLVALILIYILLTSKILPIDFSKQGLKNVALIKKDFQFLEQEFENLKNDFDNKQKDYLQISQEVNNLKEKVLSLPTSSADSFSSLQKEQEDAKNFSMLQKQVDDLQKNDEKITSALDILSRSYEKQNNNLSQKLKNDQLFNQNLTALLIVNEIQKSEFSGKKFRSFYDLLKNNHSLFIKNYDLSSLEYFSNVGFTKPSDLIKKFIEKSKNLEIAQEEVQEEQNFFKQLWSQVKKLVGFRRVEKQTEGHYETNLQNLEKALKDENYKDFLQLEEKLTSENRESFAEITKEIRAKLMIKDIKENLYNKLNHLLLLERERNTESKEEQTLNKFQEHSLFQKRENF